MATRFFGAAILALLLGFWMPTSSRAGFTLTITEGSFSETLGWGFVPPGGSNGGTSLLGGNQLLTFSNPGGGTTTFHDFTFSQISAISDSNNAAGNSNVAIVSINISGLTSKNSTKSLVITATDSGFTFPNSSDQVFSTGSSTAFPGKGSESLSLTGKAFNGSDTVNVPTITLHPGLHGGSDSSSQQSATNFDPNSSPYTITTTYTISGLGKSVQLSGAGAVNLVGTTPEPSTWAMGLSALCLVGGACWFRRR
jgi:hypothetical protein